MLYSQCIGNVLVIINYCTRKVLELLEPRKAEFGIAMISEKKASNV